MIGKTGGFRFQALENSGVAVRLRAQFQYVEKIL